MAAENVAAIDERSAAVTAGIEAVAPRWILHLPSSTLKAVVGHFLSRDGREGAPRIVPIPREEEGVGILSGLALAGVPALMVIQDNGIGNLLTALNTFPAPYHIPLLVLVTRRGGLGEYNSLYRPQCDDFRRARTQMDRSRREGGSDVAAIRLAG